MAQPHQLWAVLAIGMMSSCHSTPRTTAGDPVAHEGSIAEGLDCANCHDPSGWRIQGSDSDEGGFNHANTGFPLTGYHRGVGCMDCHQSGEPAQRECVGCHTDVHQGELGLQCDTCHSARGFHLTQAIETHRRTLLPLTGMHALVDCSECHQRQGEHFLSNIPTDCYACHEDDYRRPGVHPRHTGTTSTPPFPRDCAQCHRPVGWSPALFDLSLASSASPLSTPENHDLSFPVSFGPHRAAECASCHTAPSIPSLVRCTGCHEHSPIQIRLDHPGMHVATDGPGCLSCHPGGMPR